MTNICPECKKDDLIEKVSTRVDKDKRSGTFSGPSSGSTYVDGKWRSVDGYVTLSESTTTDLARLLAAPREPQLPLGHGWTKWGCLAAAFLVALFFLCSTIISYPIFSVAVPVPETGSPEGNKIFSQLIFIGIPCSVGLFFAALGLLSFILQKSRDKKNEAKYAIEKPQWDKAIRRWNRLYFCHRDGIVFDPETQEFCQPEAIESLIYQ